MNTNRKPQTPGVEGERSITAERTITAERSVTAERKNADDRAVSVERSIDIEHAGENGRAESERVEVRVSGEINTRQAPRFSGIARRREPPGGGTAEAAGAVAGSQAPQSSQAPQWSQPPVPLDAETRARLRESFGRMIGPKSKLDVRSLQRSLKVDDCFIATRVLCVLDRNDDGLVSSAEFEGAIPRLLFGNLRDKLRFVFRLHDLDEDGRLACDELSVMIEAGLREDGVAADTEQVARLVELLMSAADANSDGCLSLDEFETLAAQHPEVIDVMVEVERTWVGANELPKSSWFSGLADMGLFFANNLSVVAVLAAWLLFSGYLALDAAIAYQAKGPFIMVARAAGAMLNLNIALVLLPAARYVMARIRRTPVLRALPVDHAVAFHQLLACAIIGLSLVHTGAHLLSQWEAGVALPSWLLGKFYPLTGLALLLMLGIISVFAVPKIRESGHFEWFHRAHLLYPLWVAVGLMHGRNLKVWTAVPLLLFCIDRVVRYRRGQTETVVTELKPLAGGVTKVTLKKPLGFEHHAGDYAYLRLPEIARHEWHPFTISSAPERGELTFHVRSLGDFTRSLFELAQKREVAKSAALASVTSTEGGILLESSLAPLPAYLDGPLGTASADVAASEIAVLVGAGIGVTPFASVLESLVLRPQGTSLKKVYFYWLNRDGASFEWFHELLLDLEAKDAERLVDIRIFMTRGRGRSTSTILNLARDVAHRRGERDSITGLRARTNMGSPNWRKELTHIAQARGNSKVDVYFCGPPGLAWTLRFTCARLQLPFRQEHF